MLDSGKKKEVKHATLGTITEIRKMFKLSEHQ
jgi:hypothetical protein